MFNKSHVIESQFAEIKTELVNLRETLKLRFTTSWYTLNLSSIDLREVLVLIVQTPPSSDTSITGVETVAAFLSRKFTSNS